MECISLLRLENPVSREEEEEEELMVFFFFISLMFPSGKLGVGPRSPHRWSLRCVTIGETHQEIISFKNKKRTKKAMKAEEAGSPINSMISLLAYKGLNFVCCLWKCNNAKWVFIGKDLGLKLPTFESENDW